MKKQRLLHQIIGYKSFLSKVLYITGLALFQMMDGLAIETDMIVPGPHASNTEPDLEVVNKIEKILEEENKEKGSFINKVITDLKFCENRLIELNYLTVKSSYWWDNIPMIGLYFTPTDHNRSKPLIIDKKYRSSVYDREFSSFQWSSELSDKLHKSGISEAGKHYDPKLFINSGKSAQEKTKFFENKEIKDLQSIADGTMYYGIYLPRKELDTYPSIFQILKAMKKSRYNQKAPRNCPSSLHESSQASPSHVIYEDILNIQKAKYYGRFAVQNHPLSKIVQDHLQKLQYKAEKNHFKGTAKEGYKPSILYHKILTQMGNIIELMSAFDIDMEKGTCDIPHIDKNLYFNKYYLYVHFYEVFNDLLFLLMSVENGYTQKDFDDFLTKTYIDRFDVFKRLSEDHSIFMASYPMRSGMDAFVNASMAIGHAPQDISIAPKVAHLENTVYFEISNLLRNYPHRGETQSVIFLSEGTTQEQANSIIEGIRNIYIDLKVDDTLTNKFGTKWTGVGQYVKEFDEHYEQGSSQMKDFYFQTSEDELNKKKESVKKLLQENFSTEAPNDKNTIHLVKSGNGYYVRVPQFMMKLRGVFEKLIKLFPNLVESRVNVDKHYSMTSGMTTDTVDPSGKPGYIDALYNKINKVRELKHHWNPTTEPFIILWDTTMEIDQGPCYSLMAKLIDEIKDGRVVFILFKSLQKYANLGIGKSKSGVVTMIGKKQNTLNQIHQKLTQYGQDVFSNSEEYALMTFFHDRFDNDSNKTHFQDNEKLYYEAVRKHAQKIKGDNPYEGYEISGGCLFKARNCIGFPYADTFGFAIATSTVIENSLCRYSVGLDPRG